MSEPQTPESNGPDELEQIARRTALDLIVADKDVEVLRVQFVTGGTYRVEITERGNPPREEFQIRLGSSLNA